jgi:hypothetical protein
VQAVDLIQRATISPWPGTTLNLLKFPILSPHNWRLKQRMTRLKEEQTSKINENQLKRNQFLETGKLKYVTLQGKYQIIFIYIIEIFSKIMFTLIIKQKCCFDNTKINIFQIQIALVEHSL